MRPPRNQRGILIVHSHRLLPPHQLPRRPHRHRHIITIPHLLPPLLSPTHHLHGRPQPLHLIILQNHQRPLGKNLPDLLLHTNLLSVGVRLRPRIINIVLIVLRELFHALFYLSFDGLAGDALELVRGEVDEQAFQDVLGVAGHVTRFVVDRGRGVFCCAEEGDLEG